MSQDKVARAMLARNAMNLYPKMEKFLIVEKLRLGVPAPFVKTLRKFCEGQFGASPSLKNYKSEYFYQVLMEMKSLGIIEVHDGSQFYFEHLAKYLDMGEKSFVARDILREEAGIDWNNEIFYILNRHIDELYKANSHLFESRAKLIHHLVLNKISIKESFSFGFGVDGVDLGVKTES